MANEYCFSCLGGRMSVLRVGRVRMVEAFGASFATVGNLWRLQCGQKVWGTLKGVEVAKPHDIEQARIAYRRRLRAASIGMLLAVFALLAAAVSPLIWHLAGKL